MAPGSSNRPLLRPSFFRTLLIVALAGMALVLIDSVLAATERRETAIEATRSWREGQSLMQQGRYNDAADAFRSAIANARNNKEYPLALGQALLNAGQLDEAESTLTDLLNANSMAGAPNLAMARIFAKKAEFEEAEFYYHRAIYGQWPPAPNDAAANRIHVRFELADLLAARNSKAELLAELLPLQQQAPTDTDTQARLARLFMIAGAPARAVPIFHDLARADPRDSAVEAGLGEAELENGNFTAAQTAFIAALRLRPDDQNARKSLDTSEQILNLDPLRRGLDGQERYRRSQHILQLVADKAAQCPPLGDQVSAARVAISRHVSPSELSENAESTLELATKLWQAEQTQCPATITASDEPLQTVLAKAARQLDPSR